MTHKHLIEKDPILGATFRPLFGYGLIFSKNTEEYRIKRKHCAHAFYKNHMHDMQENLKSILQETFEDWLK